MLMAHALRTPATAINKAPHHTRSLQPQGESGGTSDAPPHDAKGGQTSVPPSQPNLIKLANSPHAQISTQTHNNTSRGAGGNQGPPRLTCCDNHNTHTFQSAASTASSPATRRASPSSQRSRSPGTRQAVSQTPSRIDSPAHRRQQGESHHELALRGERERVPRPQVRQ